MLAAGMRLAGVIAGSRATTRGLVLEVVLEVVLDRNLLGALRLLGISPVLPVAATSLGSGMDLI
jgi:hypothetical protein